jgi:hypothetical protein
MIPSLPLSPFRPAPTRSMAMTPGEDWNVPEHWRTSPEVVQPARASAGSSMALRASVEAPASQNGAARRLFRRWNALETEGAIEVAAAPD